MSTCHTISSLIFVYNTGIYLGTVYCQQIFFYVMLQPSLICLISLSFILNAQCCNCLLYENPHLKLCIKYTSNRYVWMDFFKLILILSPVVYLPVDVLFLYWPLLVCQFYDRKCFHADDKASDETLSLEIRRVYLQAKSSKLHAWKMGWCLFSLM